MRTDARSFQGHTPSSARVANSLIFLEFSSLKYTGSAEMCFKVLKSTSAFTASAFTASAFSASAFKHIFSVYHSQVLF